MIYENLLLNSSFESGTTGWATINGANSVVTSSTTQSFSAEKSALVTFQDPGGGTIVTPGIFSSGGSYRPNVIAGEVYTLSAYVKNISANAIPLLARVYIYNSGGSVQSYSPASALTNVTSRSEWTRVSATITVPATGALARVGFYYDTDTEVPARAGDGFYIDAVKFEKNSEPTQYVEALNQTQETDAVNDAMRPLLSGDIETRPYITGLKLQGDVSINGLLLNTIDENKVVWVCTDITGWWTLPTPEVPNIPRGLDDGSYDVRGRWLPRDITLTGSILPPTPEAAPAARERLLEALDLVYTGGWLKVDEDPVKSCFVRIVGQPQITSVNARGRIDFSVQLRAGDPIKYSWDTDADDGYTTSNVAIGTIRFSMIGTDITNSGNTKTAPIFSITGPMTAPAYITNTTTGDEIKIVKTLREDGIGGGITTLSVTSGTAIITTANAHPFLVGDTVNIVGLDSYTFLNGNKKVTNTSSTTVSFADAGVEIIYGSLTSNVVSLVTLTNHGFSSGDQIYVSGLGIPFDGTYTISTASGQNITYAKVYANTVPTYEGMVYKNIASTAADAGAAMYLEGSDTLEIDTYNTTVLYRGLPDAARSTLDAGVDWIKLQPGINALQLKKSNAAVTPASMTIKYKSGWVS